MKDNRLPHFLVIGAMRAGTTALWRLLNQHPSIHMSREKEPCFFVDDKTDKGRWNRGLDWYKELFAEAPGLRGEASTLYTRFPYHPGVVDRIHAVLPDVKLLYLVRDPVERAISQYFHSVLKGLERRSITQALVPSASSSYVLTGLYYLQLSLYLTRFAQRQLCVISSEGLWKDPRRTMRDIWGFLGVDDFAVKPIGSSAANSLDSLVEKFRRGERTIHNETQGELLGRILQRRRSDLITSAGLAIEFGFTGPNRAMFEQCFHADSKLLKEFAKQ